MAKKSYEDNGVLLSKKVLYSGDKVKVSYTGLLVQSGAESVFLYVGFGDKWENSSLISMTLKKGIFSSEIEIIESKKFGICFKDSAENWDNNSGENYEFIVSKKPEKKEKNLSAKVSKVSTKLKK
jgi:hypothetical protein